MKLDSIDIITQSVDRLSLIHSLLFHADKLNDSTQLDGSNILLNAEFLYLCCEQLEMIIDNLNDSVQELKGD